jgi:tetratricopeptide (TPR) repeat protein
MDVEDQRVLLPLLRAFLGWDQKDLAMHAGLSPSTIRRWEKGMPMRRRNYEHIVATTGMPLALVETYFLPAIRAGRAFLAEVGTVPGQSLGAADLETLTEVRHAAFSALIEELTAVRAIGQTSIEGDRESRTWRFVEGLCHESEDVASGDSERALKLAQSALRFSERAPGKGERQMKLEGYAWIFLGNALRVAGSLPKSEEAFTRAEKAWRAWKGATPIPLPDWRLPDRKASLRRHQGRFREALELHERAYALAPPEVTGRILLNKAFTLEQQGEIRLALSTLQEAENRIDKVREPRLLFGVRFNRLVNLIHLGQYTVAEQGFAQVRAMAEAACGPLDLLRVLWLESKIATGLDRLAEAADLLNRVRREFVAREIAYDAALATLELAVLYLEDGRGQEVRRIAAELAPVFAAQRVPRETLACVQLFCESVRQETITVDLTRGWLDKLSLSRATY